MLSNNSWYAEPRLLLELFVLVNLAFLSLDIYLAHSVNEFRRPAEYIPLYFSLAAPGVCHTPTKGQRLRSFLFIVMSHLKCTSTKKAIPMGEPPDPLTPAPRRGAGKCIGVVAPRLCRGATTPKNTPSPGAGRGQGVGFC